MPWSPGDAESHHKGLSPHQAEVWSRVANEILERTGDEARAIRGANAAVNRMREGQTAEVAIIESLLDDSMGRTATFGLRPDA